MQLSVEDLDKIKKAIESRSISDEIWTLLEQLFEANNECNKCGSISGVYYEICDDCMTKFNILEKQNGN